VEDWARGDARESYDLATARAVAPLAVLLEYASPLLAVGGTFVAWKGARDMGEESAAVTAAAELGLDPLEPRQVTPYPGARGLHLHLYSKVRETPERFPRRVGMAAKRPLVA
jgi:16S rRNA (guanine527-N7)-methyltransferase